MELRLRARARGLANVEATFTPPRPAAWRAEITESGKRALWSSVVLTRPRGGRPFLLVRSLPAFPTVVKERPRIANPANNPETFQAMMTD